MSQQHTPNNSPDLDLYELIERLSLFVKGQFKFLIGALVLGIISGVAHYQFAPKEYESKMLISSDLLTESYTKTIVDNLNKLVKEGNTDVLSKKMNLSPSQLSELNLIEVESAVQEDKNVPENSKVYLNVTVRVKSNSILQPLQDGIIEYLRGTEFVRTRVDQRKRYNSAIIKKIDDELVDLEVLKKKVQEGEFSSSSSNKENLIFFDPTNISLRIIDLNKDKVNLQNSLELVNSVQIVDGFVPFLNPISPKLALSVFSLTTIWLTIAVLFLTPKLLRTLLKNS